MNTFISEISGIGMVPILKAGEPADAVSLACVLRKHGVDAMLLTGETACDAIREIHKEYPDFLVGAGNITEKEQVKQVVQAGAKWIACAGIQENLVRWCRDNGVEIVPGVSTASEIETAIACGLTCVQFFPAQASGGTAALRAFAQAYPQMRFLVSGGIDRDNLHEFLGEPNVLAAVGDFIVSESSLSDKNWEQAETEIASAVKHLLGFELIHLGVNQDYCEEAVQTAQTLCNLFHFTYYKKPKSHFAGRGFEILNQKGRGKNGHIGIYTPYPEKAMRYLGKQGVRFVEESITRNKKTKAINFVYLDLEIAGFGVHLINPDVKMKV